MPASHSTSDRIFCFMFCTKNHTKGKEREKKILLPPVQTLNSDHHLTALSLIPATITGLLMTTISRFWQQYLLWLFPVSINHNLLFYIPFCLHLFQSILVIVLKSIDYLNQLDYHCSHVRKQVYTIYSHCLDWPEKREGCSQFSSLSFQTWLLLVTRIPREVLPWTDHSYHH